MNDAELSALHRRFGLGIGLGLVATPVFGLGFGYLFNLLSTDQAVAAISTGVLPGLLLALLAFAGLHFSRYIQPFLAWVRQGGSGHSTGHLQRRLARFPREYWGLFLITALATPSLFLASLPGGLAARPETFLHLLLLQLGVAVIAGMPGYLVALDGLGRLVARLGLNRVQVSMKSKLMLLGGLVPLLSYTLIMQYFWLETRGLDTGLLLIWALLAAATLALTLLSIQSLSQSLQPVEEVLHRSGASTHADLARLEPQSTDEIGYLTQTLGKLFRRLGDQESYMRAVVDTAAEGIIVVDEQGNIDTFNPAAEHLFGFLAMEIRGKPLAWLLPEIAGPDTAPALTPSEEETTGLHRNGKPLPVSIRVSRMEISHRTMYTCLVADITQRKRAEDNLIAAEARYRDLVETAHDLVWSMDPEGRWTYLNGACQSIYGYTPQEMTGRHLREFQVASHAEMDNEAFQAILTGKELVQYETVHLDREGRQHHLSFNARAHFDDAGRVMHISGTARDISEQKAFQQQLSYQAEHDSLTGLFNRHYFQQELERTVARTARHGAECALFYIDLDQFKYINDTLGHAAGDQLLVEISSLLSSHVREGDLVARFGGDEFTLLVYNVGHDQAPRVAENFRQLFEAYKFYHDGKSFNVTCSIGGAVIDHAVDSADEVMSHADLACNMAKTGGRNRVHFYNPADRDKAGMAEDMGWAARVREMLEEDRFQLVYQPIADVRTGAVTDYEVLVRMVCDDGDVILPGGFMPAAERFGLIHAVDRWIVARAIHQLTQLREQGKEVCFSINLSAKAFEDHTLLPMIQAQLADTGLDPSWLTFEITETAAIANLGAAERFIGELKNIGCQFALDDFGSGFSSFSYLKHLPVDKLKIDGSFVQGMAQAEVDQAMVQSMNQVAHALGKATIAEYVESEAILKLLQQYGVDYAQGNYIGRPNESLINPAATRPIYSNVTQLKT